MTTETRELVEQQRDEARQIVRDIYWMARRYADGRQSYAVGVFNDAVRKGYDAGWLEHRITHEPPFARDSMFSPEWKGMEQRLDEAAATITRLTEEVEGSLVPPENGETDPEWRAIRRAIDQFAGRVPTISKHRAMNNAHLAAVVERLDAAGDREAADTIVWQAWHRALDRERERFLLDDARATLARSGSHG